MTHELNLHEFDPGDPQITEQFIAVRSTIFTSGIGKEVSKTLVK